MSVRPAHRLIHLHLPKLSGEIEVDGLFVSAAAMYEILSTIAEGGYLSDDYLHAVSSAEEYGALIHAVQVLRDLDAVVRQGKFLKPSDNFNHYWSFCHQVLYDRDLRFDINTEGTWMLERC